MTDLEELPNVRWDVTLAPGMDRQEQAQRYEQAVGREALVRQVRLHRQELAKARKAKPKR